MLHFVARRLCSCHRPFPRPPGAFAGGRRSAAETVLPAPVRLTLELVELGEVRITAARRRQGGEVRRLVFTGNVGGPPALPSSAPPRKPCGCRCRWLPSWSAAREGSPKHGSRAPASAPARDAAQSPMARRQSVRHRHGHAAILTNHVVARPPTTASFTATFSNGKSTPPGVAGRAQGDAAVSLPGNAATPSRLASAGYSDQSRRGRLPPPRAPLRLPAPAREQNRLVALATEAAATLSHEQIPDRRARSPG